MNQFYPEFDRAEYHGFVTAGRSPASLVNTYGSKALMLHVQDKDFNNVWTARYTVHSQYHKPFSAVIIFTFLLLILKLTEFQSHDLLHL